MAKLNKGSIVTGGLITAADLTNVYDALGGTGAVDICVSGSLSAWNGITVSGDIIPFSGSAFNLGSATKPWNSLHLSGSTIYLWSDAGTAETLSRSNIGDLKAGRTLKAGGSGTVVTNQIVRLDGTDDGDDSNRIQILNDRIYTQINGEYSIDEVYRFGSGYKVSFGDWARTDQGATFAFKGSISSSDSISADNFIGDGSSLTNLPALEWDGTHSGNGLITGTLSAGDIKYWDGALGYNTSVSTELNSLRSATGTLWYHIQDNDSDILGLEGATASLDNNVLLLNVSANIVSSDIASLKSVTGYLDSIQTSLSTQIYHNVSLISANAGGTATIAYSDFIFGGVKTFNDTVSAGTVSAGSLSSGTITASAMSAQDGRFSWITLNEAAAIYGYNNDLRVVYGVGETSHFLPNVFKTDVEVEGGLTISGLTVNGDAEATGTLSADALWGDNIWYIDGGTYYSVEQQINSLRSATGTNWNGWIGIKNGTSTGNYNAYNLTANKLYATNNLITVYDDIKLSQSNLELDNGSVTAPSICADALYAKNLPGTNPGANTGEIWKQPLSACFLGSTSGDMLNALGSASSDLQTVLYGS